MVQYVLVRLPNYVPSLSVFQLQNPPKHSHLYKIRICTNALDIAKDDPSSDIKQLKVLHRYFVSKNLQLYTQLH